MNSRNEMILDQVINDIGGMMLDLDEIKESFISHAIIRLHEVRLWLEGHKVVLEEKEEENDQNN